MKKVFVLKSIPPRKKINQKNPKTWHGQQGYCRKHLNFVIEILRVVLYVVYNVHEEDLLGRSIMHIFLLMKTMNMFRLFDIYFMGFL